MHFPNFLRRGSATGGSIRQMTVSEILWGLGGFLIGAYLGHRFAVFRDRRSEFNEIADRVFIALDQEVRSCTPYTAGPRSDDVAILRRRMSWFVRRRFDRAFEEYNEAKRGNTSEPDGRGHVHYISVERIKQAILQVTKLLHRK